MPTFKSINFGCRVNAAETNQLSQQLIDQGFIFNDQNPDTIIVNTCAITKKGEYESISKIKKLIKDNPKLKIIATGCANLDKLKGLKNVTIVPKTDINSIYTPQIKDKFSHTNRYLLKVQSGCTQNCTFCIVPSRRNTLNFLPIDDAVKTVNSVVDNGYAEVIITGVNLTQYLPGLSNLVEELLNKTKIKLISFGSVPLLCIDEKFIKLVTENSRLSTFLHIPLQSGSDKILKLMHRPYDVKKIKDIFSKLKSFSIDNKISPSLLKEGVGGDFDKNIGTEGRLNNKGGVGGGLQYGTDIIVGFPTETDSDFQETYDLCQSLGFSKIHVFKYSPRPDTIARELFLQSEKIPKSELSRRSKLLLHK